MHRAIIQFPRHNPLTLPVLGHDQIGREILDIKLGLFLQRLAIKRVQNRMTRAVGGGTCALHRGTITKLCRVTTKGALINLALFGARERHAVMLQLIHRLGGLARQILHRVGITEPVRAFHSVKHMPLPAIRPHIA